MDLVEAELRFSSSDHDCECHPASSRLLRPSAGPATHVRIACGDGAKLAEQWLLSTGKGGELGLALFDFLEQSLTVEAREEGQFCSATAVRCEGEGKKMAIREGADQLLALLPGHGGHFPLNETHLSCDEASE